MSKVIVFVHGGGSWQPDYANGIIAKIASLLGYEPLGVPVFYADIANAAAAPGVVALNFPNQPTVVAEPPEVQQFKLQFAMQVQANMNAEPQTGKSAAISTMSLGSIAQVVSTLASQIAGYLFNPEVHAQVQARMCEGLDQAAKLGDSIVIASHSLGTVVAFDALRAVAEHYQISAWFTFGCPLPILRGLGQRGPELGAITAQGVKEWLNFYDTTDPVSNPVGPWFPLPGYRPRDVFVDVGPGLPASHDYFNNGECLQALADALQPEGAQESPRWTE